MKRVAVSSCILLAISAILLLPSALAQVDTGSIVGTVADSSGAVLSGAKVTLTNTGTGATLSTTTGADGIYKFSPVRIGTYTLETAAQGFKTVSQNEVRVEVGSNVQVNFTLTPGSTTETIEVTAAAPVLQTQDASVGQVVDQTSINNAPLNGRNFTFLAQLAAGVNTPQPDTRGNAASGAFSANGFRPAQNNYMLDGIDNNSDTVDFLNGTNYVVLPPVDAIQEFKVQTTDFGAEFGRSGAAVLNATLKSGTNNFHGDVWEFFRNDKLDARDFFEHNCNAGVCTPSKKGELRWNQFGGTLGGPVIKNKIFFFGDMQFWRLRQGQAQIGSVPTAAERTSGYTDFSDLIQPGTSEGPDALGRSFPKGTIFDPATTRAVGASFVRDPFPGNIIPANRLDPNAINLLNLYPAPTNGGVVNNYANSPVLIQNEKQFDVRLDLDFTQKDQLYYSFSYDDKPELIPSIFGGIADGGGFFQGNQTALSQHSALVWNHTFSPTTINVARVGLNYLHTTRNIPEADNLKGTGGNGIPADFGILGIPQDKENGGLPAFSIGGLQTLGGNSFLPSDEVSSTIQVTDDFTKIYGKHTFKMGFEQQHVKFSTLQPPWSRGQFDFNGAYTQIPNIGDNTTGRAQFLLLPTTSNVGGLDYVGGPNEVFASNISLSDNGKNYWGTYFQDDWKVSSKLTLNLGLRWDFFGLVYDHYGKQANFVPFGPPTGAPMYLVPQSANSAASNFSTSFNSLMTLDNINLAVTNRYGKGLGTSQKGNFAPRFGFAYQVTPKFVARGGFGIFYNGFENRGYSPNLGENYPFQFSFDFNHLNDWTPVTYSSCPAGTATAANSATLATGFSCIPLTPQVVNAQGLQLRGIQFDYQTPYSMGGNFTLQYELRPSLSLQAAYVTTLGRHLEVFPGSNEPSVLFAPGTGLTKSTPTSVVPLAAQGGLQFPDFAEGASYATTQGSSYYHGLQTTVTKKFSGGLNFLATYTYSKVRSDALDLLNGFSGNGYRAPYVPGVGIHADYGLANFDVRNVFHLSGGYELPFGKGKRMMGDATGAKNAILGGWALQWVVALQGGQPFKIDCPSGTAQNVACYAFVLPGQNPRTSLHINPDGNPDMLNAAAFAQPCQFGVSPAKPAGCVPLTTPAGYLGGNQPSQIAGPPFYRWDLSLFKNFQITERVRMEFRSEFFNILNHPNFNYPGFGGNGVNAVSGSTDFTNANFGEIGSTRDNPLDPREIQFALKLYF
ncbi:MAG TPA: TonB-dependent receptor [Terriglobales bacterium]|jgi:hypothetical protein